MDITKQINDILEKNGCNCFYFDTSNLLLRHNLTKEESRHNVCNHKVFVEITGLLVMNDIKFEVTDNNDIQIFL